MAEHAELGASSSERWLKCAGSVRESRGRPNKTSIYAIEGTAAHDVAARCLRENREAIEFLDRYIEVIERIEDKRFKEGFRPVIHKILCDDEMVEGVQLYLDLCYGLNDYGFGDNLIFVETKVSINELVPTYPKPLFGTCDYGIYKRSERRLIVTDFKYGQGIIVEVEDNSQAMYYALGLLLMLKDEQIDIIELIICQPRGRQAGLSPIRRVEITVDQLLDRADNVLIPGIWATEAPDAPLVAGDHCQFCLAAAECETLRRYALDNALVLFDDLDAMPVESVKPTPPSKLNVQQIAQLLECSETIMLWLRAVREHAFGLLNAGVEIPGWKIVGRSGRRRWTDATPEETAATLAFSFGLPVNEMWNLKIRSPAQIEAFIQKTYKKVGASKKLKAQIQNAGLWEKPTTGTTLAKRDDVREEVLGVDLASFERLDPPFTTKD